LHSITLTPIRSLTYSTITTLPDLFLITFVSLSHSLASDNNNVSDSMNSFWHSLGSNTNYTRAYKTQTAHYYTGPNLYARSKIVDVNPVTIQLPRFRAGCGGIDMFTGLVLHYIQNNFFIHK